MLGCACLAPASRPDERLLVTFERRRLSETFFCEGASFGDFDRDGHGDVVSGPYWYAGPDFEQRHEIHAPVATDPLKYSDSFFFFVHDFDADGWPDVLEIGFPGRQARWYANLGEGGGHWPMHVVFEGVDNEAPGFGDLTGDGQPEMFFHTRGRFGWAGPDPRAPREPWVFHAISEDLGLSNFEHGLGIGDVDGDGRMDLLDKGGWWEQPDSLAGDPLWTRHPHAFSLGRRGGAQMFASDVDGDGDNDVITSLDGHGWGFSWFESVRADDGTIDFREHRIMDSRPEDNRYGVKFSQLHALDLADVDGDGLQDVVTGKRFWAHGPDGDPESRAPAVVYWFELVRGADGVEFVPHLIDDDSGVGVQVVAGDVDGDGRADVVVGNKQGTTVFLQRARKVSEEEWRATRPREYVPPGVEPLDEDGGALNLGFETGSLARWTATGDAFEGQPMRGDTVVARGRPEGSRHAGEHWIGGYEVHGDERTGTLTSDPFRVTHPFASFMVAGGNHEATRVELVRATDGVVIADVSGANHESLQRFVVDLRARQGEMIRVRIVDEHTGGWGHVNFDDFRFHACEPVFARDHDLPALMERVKIEHSGLAAPDAALAMTVPAGFAVDLIAAEPDLHQPIALALDHRGRIWVAEAYSYPIRRPDGEGQDHILVFEDADHDGSFEKRTVFADDLNLVSGLQVGFGGVWVGAAPYLMFIPDRDGDLVPDGEAEILLDGWGYQDTHETLNAFIWGPDGWLYGCHGVFTHSRVGKPGTPDEERTPLNAGVWRYHPQRHEFEVFAWGTSNPWGVDFDEHGQAFLTACVIPHLFHVVQGARYHRQGGTHFDPHVYDDIKTIADHRHYAGDIGDHAWWGREEPANLKDTLAAGGGHAHCGAMIYLGESFPEQYRNTLFVGNVHGNRFNNEVLEREGSGFVGRHGPDFLLANDEWFRGINLKYGPGGSVYFIDWYDATACHRTETERWDRTNGRLYRVRYGDHRPSSVAVDQLDEGQLHAAVLSSNEWMSRHARQVLQEQGASPELRARLATDLELEQSAEHRLRALWALHVSGGLDGALVRMGLGDPSEHVQGWTVQLALEACAASPELVTRLEHLARKTPSPVVRLYLASALQRLPEGERWRIASALLARGEDAEDHNLPLVTWYGIEPLVAQDPARALALARAAALAVPARFVARRAASEVACHDALVSSIADADGDWLAILLEETSNALSGERGTPMPAGWNDVHARLAASEDPEVRERAFSIAVAFGDASVFPELRGILADGGAEEGRRERALDALVRGKDAAAVPVMHALLDERAVRERVLRALASFNDAGTPAAILARYSELSQEERRAALSTLAARPAYARELLRAVAAGQPARAELDALVLRQLQSLHDEEIDGLMREVWGVFRETAEERAAEIERRLGELTGAVLAQADPSNGRDVFSRTCEQCHTLFGVGGDIGPELTGANRTDLEYILTNAVDPNAIIAKEYQVTSIILDDERVVSGILRKETEGALTLINQDEEIVVAKDEIVEIVPSEVSMMPEAQLDAMSADEVRDLIAYLASPKQVPVLATELNKGRFFGGTGLEGWRGSPEVWTIEGGEIVGRTDGLERNEFLRSDMLLGDFRLTVEVRLVENEGNSGIQFRSEEIEGGAVKGYQADIGAGWWGKIYEEHGRGLLWDRSGEEHVDPDGWNTYEVLAVGGRVRTALNGAPCADIEDPEGAPRGIVAFQVHSGGPTEVRFRNPRLELEPELELKTLRPPEEKKR